MKTTTHGRPLCRLRSAPRVSYRIFFILPILGVLLVNDRSAHADELPTGPRAEAWKRVEQALGEGTPKTAAEALAGVEQAAAAAKAWDEVARAIATRVLTETGDRPPEDPERLVRLAAALETAPPETRAVLDVPDDPPAPRGPISLVLAARRAVHPAAAHDATIVAATCSIYGLFNGIFVGRLARYLAAWLRQPVAVAA